MTKQKEIREGIARRFHIVERQLLRVVEETSPCNCRWEHLSEHFKNQYRKEADRTLAFLHSQGVVIKTDGKLPLPGITSASNISLADVETIGRAFQQAYLGLFEPLIEGEK